MANVKYIARTSSDHQMVRSSESESVEQPEQNIPKRRKKNVSVSFSTEDKVIYPFNHYVDDDSDHPNRSTDGIWKQQMLPAWQPILTSDTVLPAFFLLGIAMIPIGVGLLLSSNYVKEISYEYTHCVSTEDLSTKCAENISKVLKKSVNQKCQCWQNFTLDEDINAPVFFYYGLSDFYQNHRRYVQSLDSYQLEGKTDKDLSIHCEPFKKRDDVPIAPCGAIANSFFNDTFKLYLRLSDETDLSIDLTERDIAWPTDKDQKYKNPAPEKRFKYINPYNWHKSVFDLDLKREDNNGYENEHFIVWMRTAAFPTFRKLWARINHDQNTLWRTKLPKGNYALLINYSFPVIYKGWKGGKYFYISNTSWLGGKNDFLGYAYIVVGVICLLLCLMFFLMIRRIGKIPELIIDIDQKTTFESEFIRPKKSVNWSKDLYELDNQAQI